MPAVKRRSTFSAAAAVICFSVTCSAPPKPSIPSLTPETAYTLLQNNGRAKDWITYVRKQKATCRYDLMLPDQSSHPDVIDLTHVVTCGGAPAPKEYDASVSFEYDKQAQHWTVSRFSS